MIPPPPPKGLSSHLAFSNGTMRSRRPEKDCTWLRHQHRRFEGEQEFPGQTNSVKNPHTNRLTDDLHREIHICLESWVFRWTSSCLTDCTFEKHLSLHFEPQNTWDAVCRGERGPREGHRSEVISFDAFRRPAERLCASVYDIKPEPSSELSPLHRLVCKHFGQTISFDNNLERSDPWSTSYILTVTSLSIYIFPRFFRLHSLVSDNAYPFFLNLILHLFPILNIHLELSESLNYS